MCVGTYDGYDGVVMCDCLVVLPRYDQTEDLAMVFVFAVLRGCVVLHLFRVLLYFSCVCCSSFWFGCVSLSRSWCFCGCLDLS